MQIKSWESPRRRGRNDKGKGGSARQRQLKKRDKMLTNKLKRNTTGGEHHPSFSLRGCFALGIWWMIQAKVEIKRKGKEFQVLPK